MMPSPAHPLVPPLPFRPVPFDRDAADCHAGLVIEQRREGRAVGGFLPQSAGGIRDEECCWVVRRCLQIRHAAAHHRGSDRTERHIADQGIRFERAAPAETLQPVSGRRGDNRVRIPGALCLREKDNGILRMRGRQKKKEEEKEGE